MRLYALLVLTSAWVTLSGFAVTAGVCVPGVRRSPTSFAAVGFLVASGAALLLAWGV